MLICRQSLHGLTIVIYAIAFSQWILLVRSEICNNLSNMASRYTTFSITLVFFTAALWGAGSYMQQRFAGKKPSVPFEKYRAETQIAEVNESISSTKEDALANPENAEKWLAYKDALVAKLRSLQKPDKMVFAELTQVLAKLKKLDPENTQHRFNLADLYFSIGMFEESASEYKALVALLPEDEKAVTSYASTLTFLKRFDEAIELLQNVQQNNPKSFHAAAYLAITYSEKGDKDETLKSGDLALSLAPNDEAFSRFSTFFTKWKRENGIEEKPKHPVVALREFFQSHPITQSKFRGMNVNGEVLEASFSDFPMSAMPKVAKDKFYGRLRELLKGVDKYRSLIFLDFESGTELDSMPLRRDSN